MKFYSKPEIEALALETVDVIETSGALAASEEIKNQLGQEAEVALVDQQISKMTTDWQW